MNKRLELRELFSIIYKRKGLIIIMTLLAIILGVLYSMYWVELEYKSSTTLMVNSSKGLSLEEMDSAVYIGSINLSQKLVVTYMEIVKSRAVLEKVSDEMGIGYSFERILSMVDVTQIEDTEFFKIEVTDTDPVRAQQITEYISNAFIAQIASIFRVDNVETIDSPTYQGRPTNDRSIMNISVALVLGLMIGLFVAFSLEYNDRNITTESDVEKYLGMSSLGMIPEYSKDMKKLIVHDAPKSPISEAYRNIRTNLLYADINHNIRTVLFTSSKSGEGKTTTLCNVALSLADSEKRVIIVDCNLRNPRIHKLFGLSNIQGVTDVILKVHQYNSLIHRTSHPGLDVITSGRIPTNPSEILDSDKIKLFFKQLSEEYDYVFIDSAPVVPVTDTVIISTYIDRVVIVCESGNLEIDMAQKAKERLEKVGANVLGIVINKVKMNKKNFRDYFLYANTNKD